MAFGANSINLLFVIIVEIGGAFATVAAVKTDITWIKRVIEKHGDDITKFSGFFQSTKNNEIILLSLTFKRSSSRSLTLSSLNERFIIFAFFEM